MSTHSALVVHIEPIRLEHTDNLSMVKVGNYTCVIRTEDWTGKNRAVYLEPNCLADVTIESCKFLEKDAKYSKDCSKGTTHARIKAKRLQQTQSYGVLVPVSNSLPLGTDMWETLNLGWYEPQTAESGKSGFQNGEVASAPVGFGDLPKYDVESCLKPVVSGDNTSCFAKECFIPGEPVIATLKFHGQSIAMVYSGGEFHVRSRSEWKREFSNPPKADKEGLIAKLGEEKGIEVFNKIQEKAANHKPARSSWWTVLRENENIQKFLMDNPDTVIWGEQIGNSVQGGKFTYGLPPGKLGFRCFDISKGGRFLDFYEARELGKDLPWVDILWEKPFDLEDHIKYVENFPDLNNGVKVNEGLVLRTQKVRYHPLIGQVKLKLINPKYIEL